MSQRPFGGAVDFPAARGIKDEGGLQFAGVFADITLPFAVITAGKLRQECGRATVSGAQVFDHVVAGIGDHQIGGAVVCLKGELALMAQRLGQPGGEILEIGGLRVGLSGRRGVGLGLLYVGLIGRGLRGGWRRAPRRKVDDCPGNNDCRHDNCQNNRRRAVLCLGASGRDAPRPAVGTPLAGGRCEIFKRIHGSTSSIRSSMPPNRDQSAAWGMNRRHDNDDVIRRKPAQKVAGNNWTTASFWRKEVSPRARIRSAGRTGLQGLGS